MTKILHRAGLPAVCVMFFAIAMAMCASQARAAQGGYLQDDTKISGLQINTFTDEGQAVSVIAGDFRLVVGKRTVSGQKAVLWVKSQGSGQAVKHEITIYLEGDASVTGPESSTSDKMMLVKLRVQGRISMDGRVSTKSLKNFPLYRRALAVRQEEAQMTRDWRKRKGSAPPRPAVVVRKSAKPAPAPAKKTAPAKRPARDAVALEEIATPAEPGAPQRLSDIKKKPAAVAKKTAKPTQTKTPPAPRAKKIAPKPGKDELGISAVHVEAAGGLTGEKDPKDPNRRIIVSRDKVFISMGPNTSRDHMELRANYAVIFTRKGLGDGDKNGEKIPYAPPVMGMGGSGERITGVYLEGDVIMTRGERKITCKAMYYDFIDKNATILKPVFRTIQAQRNVPIYIRGDKARIRSMRETEFYNAVVSTSDFKTPTYHFGARRFTVRDETPYDKSGERLSERRLVGKYEHGVMAVRGIPFFWSPVGKVDMEEGHTALRKIQPVFGGGQREYGLETEWDLFRLLGVVKPDGFSARLIASGYNDAALMGVDMDYERREGNRQYSGYALAFGALDFASSADFGDENTVAIEDTARGRLLMRHKEFLPRDWQIQAELSLLSDPHYLQEFFSNEFWAGKEQENLIYAKKQRDNWAVTALLKTRLNYFLTQTESYPDVSAYLIGQPVWDNRLTYFGEVRTGAKRLHAGSDAHRWEYRRWRYSGKHADRRNDLFDSSNVMARFDTRHEIDLPLALPTPIGPVNVVPYAVGRLSAWTDSPGDNAAMVRPYAQFGVRSNMHFWRIYNNAKSRLWDVNKLKHIITPEANFFTSFDGGTGSEDLYQMDRAVEGINQNTGAQFALYQRLQTKRGPAGNQQTIDWMRFNVKVGIFDRDDFSSIDERGRVSTFASDGRYFFSRPEYSLARNYLSADYLWNISDSTAFMADIKWDLDEGHCDLWNVGFAIDRSPRLSYYVGLRYIDKLDSNTITFGAKYKINKKYTVSFFEQYDFRTNDGQNLGTRMTVVRRFPRWNVGLTLMFDQRYHGEDEFGAMLSIWHAGIPEAYITTGTLQLLNESDKN